MFLFLLIVVSGCKEEFNKKGAAIKLSGGYSGLLPCPDCEGMNYILTINDDFTYREKIFFLGTKQKPVAVTGNWEFESLDKIKLFKKTGAMSNFLVTKDGLLMLDSNGNKITGPDENKYLIKTGVTVVPTKQDSTAPPPPPLDPNSLDGHWYLTELNGQKLDLGSYKDGIPDLYVSLTDNKFSGYTGCNATKGGLQVKGQKLTFSKFLSSKKTCDGTFESEYISALGSADSYKIENGILSLKAAGKTIMKYQR